MPAWKGIVGKGFNATDFQQYVQTIKMGAWHPQFIVLHNTYRPRLSDWHEVPGLQRMQNLERYYRDTQHWSAGPHLFVADDLIWVFTPLDTPGVHSPSWNAISWGVELVGDYSTEDLSLGVQENTVQALAALYAFSGLTPDRMRLHKDNPRTTHKDCPGAKILKNDVIGLVTACLAHRLPGEHIPGALA